MKKQVTNKDGEVCQTPEEALNNKLFFATFKKMDTILSKNSESKNSLYLYNCNY